jgi:hypothetical protein
MLARFRKWFGGLSVRISDGVRHAFNAQGPKDPDDDSPLVIAAGLIVTCVGFVAVLCQTWGFACLGLLWALALYAMGVFIGFLFGITRVVENTAAAGGTTSPLRYLPNTGVEQIADWLTKIIVGLTLVELRKIPPAIASFSAIIAMSLGNSDRTRGLAYAMVLFFPIMGFLGMYLSTRLYLNQGIRRADDRVQQISTAAGAAVEVKDTGLLNPNKGVTAKMKETAEDIIDVPLDKLSDPDDIAAWARAQSILGKWPAAIKGFAKAIEAKKLDPKLRLDYAVALFNNEGASETVSEEIVHQLEAGLDLVDPKKDPDLASRLQENLVLASLYLPKPESFTEAISLVDKLIDSPLPKRATTYFYAACAYGQKYGYFLGKDTSAANSREVKQARSRVLSYTRKALELDPSLLPKFQRVSDPDYPDKVKADSDLEAFDNDADFRKLVPKAPPQKPRGE